jgi:hypothetical protein
VLLCGPVNPNTNPFPSCYPRLHLRLLSRSLTYLRSAKSLSSSPPVLDFLDRIIILSERPDLWLCDYLPPWRTNQRPACCGSPKSPFSSRAPPRSQPLVPALSRVPPSTTRLRPLRHLLSGDSRLFPPAFPAHLYSRTNALPQGTYFARSWPSQIFETYVGRPHSAALDSSPLGFERTGQPHADLRLLHRTSSSASRRHSTTSAINTWYPSQLALFLLLQHHR